jgi:acyl carrier protein
LQTNENGSILSLDIEQGKDKHNTLIQMQERVIYFIKEYFALHDMDIDGESRLRKDLGLSSFELREMCCTIEDELNVKVSEANLKKVVTINDVVKSLYFATKQA